MANPRQRSKQKSRSRAVSHSRRAKTLLKKTPTIRGPKVLQDAWDTKKTTRQNYAALGLATSFNPHLSGGVEKGTILPETSSSKPTATTEELPQRFGRIIRDADGNVTGIELPPDEEDEGMQEDETEAGLPAPESNIEKGTREKWVQNITQIDAANATTPVVNSLEKLAKSQGSKKRFASSAEATYLHKLVAAYDQDVEAMARDRKKNPDQRTAGELRRAIAKAGGFAKLKRK